MPADRLNKIESENRDLKLRVKQLEAYLEGSSDGIMVLRSGGVVDFVNRAAYKILGRKGKDIIGKKFTDVITPGNKTFVAGQWGASIKAAPKAAIYETEILTTSGERKDLFVSQKAIRLDGKTECLLAVKDVTSRGLLERRLNETREYLDTILKMSHDGIVVLDPAGHIEFCNEAVTRMFGWGRDDLIGQSFTRFVVGDSRAKTLKKWRLVRSSGEGGSESVVRTREGEERTILYSYACMKVGGLIRYPMVIKDITRRKQRENTVRKDRAEFRREIGKKKAELDTARDELRSARHLSEIGTLAAMVAHELRTPLGVIKAAAYNVKRKSGKEPVDGHVANIDAKVDESNQIIENLLDYAKMKMPQTERTAVSPMLKECVKRCRASFGAKGANVSVDIKLKKKDMAMVDPLQIRQVLNNVLDNACQALPGGKGAVNVTARMDGKNTGIVVVVEDTGCGIREEDLTKIFDPFFSRKAKGTGLGLAVCRRIVELHHGEITVMNRDGGGSSVRIALPSA
jgi:PAS domain S-box-containing protein